jgi:hypothetical protein
MRGTQRLAASLRDNKEADARPKGSAKRIEAVLHGSVNIVDLGLIYEVRFEPVPRINRTLPWI